MTRPVLDERDPQPARPWTPTSHEWARRQAREALQQKLRDLRESRKKPADTARPTDRQGEGA